jgi:hypothetical protein
VTLASPAMGAVHLEDYGLRWSHAPAVVGHARSGPDDDAPLIYRDPATTAAELAVTGGYDPRWHVAVNPRRQVRPAVTFRQKGSWFNVGVPDRTRQGASKC